MTEIFLIRHGESIANLHHIAAGHVDPPLSELGIRQAEITADAIADVEFDAIYSSDLSRAYDTALPNAERRGMTVEKRRNLREVFLGEWEGMCVDDIIEKYGKESYYDGWRENFGTYIIPGGEGAVPTGKRIYAELEEICKEIGKGRILVTSHGAAIRAFYCLVLGLMPEEFAKGLPYPSNASISRVNYDNGVFAPIEYSEDSHMEKIGITKVNW